MATVQKLTLPVALGSYTYIFKPRKPKNPTDTPKYGICLLWDKTDEAKLAPLKAAIAAVATEAFGPKAVEKLKKGVYKSPLRDGDVDRDDEKEDSEMFAGKIFANASSKFQPGIVDRQLNEIIDESEAYSGCFFRAAVAVYAFDFEGKKGVAIGLNNLQVVKKGKRIDGRTSAAEEFKDFAEEDEDESEEAEVDEKPAKKSSKKPVEEKADID
jgi:hypothetical protein